MSVGGWVFMVGFRVLDVGLLAGWLFWFFRRVLDDDGEDDDDRRDDGGLDAPRDPRPTPGGGTARPWPRRLREHGDRGRTRRPRRPATVTDLTRERERTF
jgi:hypothetical protein